MGLKKDLRRRYNAEMMAIVKKIDIFTCCLPSSKTATGHLCKHISSQVFKQRIKLESLQAESEWIFVEKAYP